MTARDSFHLAAERLSRYFEATAQKQELDRAAEAQARRDLEAVQLGLERFLLANFITLGTQVLDIVDVAIDRLREHMIEGKEQLRSPADWLVKVARNAAISAARKERGLPLPDQLHEKEDDRQESEDDNLARALDEAATSRSVYAAMRLARQAGDHQAVRLAGLWLEMAEESARGPSNRQLASRAGVSHTTVNDALKRFRGYLAEVGAPAN